MSESLKEYQDNDDRALDECSMVSALLDGVVEIADIVPAKALTDMFCRLAFETYLRTHKKGEAVDVARLAQAMGGGTMLGDLLKIRQVHHVYAEDALSIARSFRQRHEGTILAAELETNIPYLRYGYDTAAAAVRCQSALDLYRDAIVGQSHETGIDAILHQHGDRILTSRQDGGIPFGIPVLDKHVGGLHLGELLVFAARPKKGKTSLLASVIEAANVDTLIFSLEMTALEFLKMLICIHGRIPADDIRERLPDVDAAKESLRRRPIEIIDTPGLNVDDIATACYARRGVQLIVIDYLQILGKVRGAESSRESLVESVKSLKTLAKRLEVTVIAGSQIGRDGDDKPTAKHLAESDEILRSADAVLVMDWKSEDTTPETKWSRPPVDVDIALTQRHGPGAKFPLAFYRSQRRFAEIGICASEDL